MNLFQETHFFVRWFVSVMGTFFQVRPWTTLGIVLMAACSRVTFVLATFMPLKVVLLAGSSGIPKYFEFFIQPEQKDIWILILAAGAIGSYAISVFLDSLKDKLSHSSSAQILQEAEAIPLLNNQQDIARDYYAKFCSVLADIVFVAAALTAGLFVNLWLFLFVVLLMFLSYALSAFWLKSTDHSQPGRMAVYIQTNLNDYTKTFSTVLFLASFVFLLIPFLATGYSNILAAILSIILIRQMLGAQTASIKNAVSLARAMPKINALVFRNVQFLPQENPIEKARRDFFSRQARQQLAWQELSKVMHLEKAPEVYWKDPAISEIDRLFIIAQPHPEHAEKYLLQQIFPPKQYQKLEHELFLFQHISRQDLLAPELITMFTAGPFQCLISECGAGRGVPRSKWPAVEPYLTELLCTITPPEKMVRIYSASAPLLQHRLHDEFIACMEIAVDNEEQRLQLQHFQEILPWIRDRLQSLPLYVYNPGLAHDNVVLGQDTDYFILSWCRWTLEPVGAGFPKHLLRKGLGGFLERLHSNRADMPADMSKDDILLASWCYDLEATIKKRQYKSGLKKLRNILQLVPLSSKQVNE